MTTRVAKTRPAGPAYLKLVRRFPLRPLADEAENERAIAIVAELGARPLEPGERDYLQVLVGLIEKFEEARYPIPDVSGTAMVRHLIDARGTTQAAVAAAAGIAATSLSEILTGKRKLSVKNAKALARHFNVPVDLIVCD